MMVRMSGRVRRIVGMKMAVVVAVVICWCFTLSQLVMSNEEGDGRLI